MARGVYEDACFSQGSSPLSWSRCATVIVQARSRPRFSIELARQKGRACCRPAGRHPFADLVALDGSNHTAVMFDFDNIEAQGMLALLRPEIAAQAQAHGVTCR